MIINGEKTMNNPAAAVKDISPHVVQANRVAVQHQPMKSQQSQHFQPTRDEPPPYVPNTAASVSASGLLQPSAVTRSVSQTPPRPQVSRRSTTNYLYLKTRHEPITGTFHIDPEMGTVALGKGGVSTEERRDYNQKHSQRHRHHGRKGFFKRSELPHPNAIFETRQGDMTLELGVMASPGSSKSRALVQAATRQGSVKIDLLGIHAQRQLNLEVSSRKGNVHILIPRSFSGYIQLYSRHGELLILPRLSQVMQLVYRRDKEMQLVVGRDTEAPSPDKAPSSTGDTIHVSSRHGNIVIGYLLEDTVPPKEPGLWKKLAEFFQPKSE